MNFFKNFFASLRLHEAIRKADKAHLLYGNRYYVLPVAGKKNKLIVIDRANFRKLKFKHYINQNSFVNDLERECFYHTPYRNGTGGLSAEAVALKKKQYFSWLEAIAKSKKNGQVRKH